MAAAPQTHIVKSSLRKLSESPPRLGAILLSTDLVFEADAARLLDPEQAVLHVARIGFENPTTPATLRAMAPDLARTAGLLVPGADLAAVAFACTSASVTIGNGAVADAIHVGLPGVPIFTPSYAAMAGFAALGVTRVALLTPYLPETTEPMVEYFENQGLDVVNSACFALEDDRDMARIDDDSMINAACALDTPEVEAVFLSCTAMRGVDVIDRIEARLGKPVVTSNQALCWALGRIAGGRGRPEQYGRLRTLALPAAFANGIGG
ncbi:aspartate/glutamate racemase family protein [Oceaniglobus ichthyenteri]|uniref:aspartate racemase/maleate isomerase family protein n=1 Tax=Oceaniglobus ichthyenteri TaxID=2136177 RepID=UPI0013DE428E|nr:aspartate/glutamate racemase family protein [Oceaniglobus ichthyenteri]